MYVNILYSRYHLSSPSPIHAPITTLQQPATTSNNQQQLNQHPLYLQYWSGAVKKICKTAPTVAHTIDSAVQSLEARGTCLYCDPQRGTFTHWRQWANPKRHIYFNFSSKLCLMYRVCALLYKDEPGSDHSGNFPTDTTLWIHSYKESSQQTSLLFSSNPSNYSWKHIKQTSGRTPSTQTTRPQEGTLSTTQAKPAGRHRK